MLGTVLRSVARAKPKHCLPKTPRRQGAEGPSLSVGYCRRGQAGFWIDQVNAAAKRARHRLVNAIVRHRRIISDKSLHIVSGRRAAIWESGHAAT